ncbi:MAG: 4Fe-4S binding protein [Atribacterota bacterium]|nr:4Fe-4S binding protein [Atribacterota bacterium]
MNTFKYIIINIIETLLRMFPFPCKPGLIRIGNPDQNSPVFLTCNFHLTVERVKRALRGINCYLLIANSKGINVWCAATGGHLTDHSVISILKTSGIEKLVSHRKITLPQLAASGIEAKTIKNKTGWEIIWGPVYAKDIPLFITNNFKKTSLMREVEFPLLQRLEMAVAWAFPISTVFSLIMIPFWPKDIFSIVSLIWILSFLIFISFPAYRHLLSSKGKRIGFIFFNFGRGGFQLILWAVFIFILTFYQLSYGNFSWGFNFHWSFISLIIILILSIDLMGSTPLYKSSLHEDRLLKVILDREKCKGIGFCEQVCPRNCFKIDKSRQITTMPAGSVRCIQCGACIIQCPLDALCFKNPEGDIISPDTIRKFKLNLMGKRSGV